MDWWDSFDCEIQCEEVFDEMIVEHCDEVWDHAFEDEN